MQDVEIWLNFLNASLEHAAWPIVVLASVGLLRRPVFDLAKSIRRLKYKDAEIDFDREVDKFLDTAREVGATLIGSPGAPSQSDISGWNVHELKCRIISDWAEIETMIKDWFTKNEPDAAKPRSLRSVGGMLDQLAAMGAIDPNLRRLIDSFRLLRNRAAHGTTHEISTFEMLEVLGSSQSIRTRLARALADFDPESAVLR